MTVLEAIQKSADFLTKKSVDSPRLQAELLLAHLLKMPRMKLYLNFERALSVTETDALREVVKRRGQREPLQHITGSTSFCGLEMAVNRHVLVPRPETEILADPGWEFLKHPTSNIQHPTSNEGHDGVAAGILPAVEPGVPPGGNNAGDSEVVKIFKPSPSGKMPPSTAGGTPAATTALDFGTGSGCIAIAMAVKCPAAQITAVDVSAEALAVAKQNAERHGVAERIQFLKVDGSSVASPHQFDLVISNPPYIPTAEIETLQPEVGDFDPRGALDGGADGLDFYRKLAKEAAAWLKPGGKIMLEFGDGQAEAIRKIFENEKWIVEAVKDDYSRRQRILIAKSSSSSFSSSTK